MIFLRAQITVATILTLSSAALASPAVGQKDDFESGTTQGWSVGSPSPLPLVNVATGGPAGANDNFLKLSASGGSGAGSRLVSFNQVQWAGAYPPQIASIDMDLQNFGPAGNPFMRLVFRNAFGDTFTSANPITLPVDGQWHHASFSIKESDLVNLFGSNYATTFGAISEVRLVSTANAASGAIGDVLNISVGVDNVEAKAVPEPGLFGMLPAAMLLVRRARRHMGR